jgi:hypothetical protein
LGLAQASPVRAEDPVVRTQPLDTSILEDVVEGIGGILGVLVGPPISSPTPYIEGKELPFPGATPSKDSPNPVNAAAPQPDSLPPPVPVPPVTSPAAVAPPAPASSEPPAAVPLPAVKNVAVQPSAPPVAPPPPPRPAAPVVSVTAVPAAPAAVPAPACSVRVAATATLEQMRRLPRCP